MGSVEIREFIQRVCSMDPKEIREWVQFCFMLIGGTLGLIVFYQNTKQRRLDNAIKLVSTFRDMQNPEWLNSWKSLFVSSSELSGAKPGEYMSENYGPRPISDYFSEGSPDNSLISTTTENLEIICHEVCKRTVDARYVWFELGQIISTIHYWIANSDSGTQGKSILEVSFPCMNKMFKTYGKKFSKWPTRRYEYIE